MKAIDKQLLIKKLIKFRNDFDEWWSVYYEIDRVIDMVKKMKETDTSELEEKAWKYDSLSK